MERANYTEFEGGFNQVVLEESFVLNVKTTMSFVEIPMNFAVNENYPLYTPPEIDPELEPDEQPQYTYRRGRIFFPNMEEVRWQSRIQPYIDPASGSVDYGAIDYFYRMDGRYYLAGYWGEMDLISGPPILEIEELKDVAKNQASPKNAADETESAVS
jgi:hypothetical protein